MQTFIEAFCQRFYFSKLDSIPFPKTWRSKLGIRTSRIALVMCTFWVYSVLSQYGLKWISSAIGLLYPAYKTAKMIKLLNDESEIEGKFWLTYWIVYGCLTLIESVLASIFPLVSYYYLAKSALLLWLVHPSSEGALKVYENIIKKYLKKYQPTIDEKLAPIQRFDSQEFVKNTLKTLTMNTINTIASSIQRD